MFGQNPYGSQQNYGPVNALADILGAYMQKKNEDGAYSDAANVATQADKLSQPKYNQVAVAPEEDASQIAAKSFMPSQMKPSDITGLSPLASQQNASAPGNSGLVASMKQWQALNPNGAVTQVQADEQPQSLLQAEQNWQNTANPDSPGNRQSRQTEYDQFAAAKAANPDWYVGDTYVGTDAATKTQAQANLPQTQQQQSANNSLYSFANPMQQEYGFQDDQAPKTLSYNEYASQLKNLKIQTMKDLVQKHGLAMAEKVSGMVDGAIQDKLSAYADQQDSANRQAVAPYLLRDLSTPQSKQQALWALQEYNNAAKQMGKPGLDMNNMAQIIAANDVNITAKDLGGQIQYVATPKNSATFNDGSVVKPIFTANKSMTPDASANLQFKYYDHDNASANAKLQSATTLKAEQMRTAARAPSRSGANTQLTAAKGIIASHQSWVNSHKQDIQMGNMQETDDPNYGTYQNAQQILAQAAGISQGVPQQQAGAKIGINSDAENKIYDTMMSRHPDWNDDQIKQYISDNYNVQ